MWGGGQKARAMKVSPPSHLSGHCDRGREWKHARVKAATYLLICWWGFIHLSLDEGIDFVILFCLSRPVDTSCNISLGFFNAEVIFSPLVCLYFQIIVHFIFIPCSRCPADALPVASESLKKKKKKKAFRVTPAWKINERVTISSGASWRFMNVYFLLLSLSAGHSGEQPVMKGWSGSEKMVHTIRLTKWFLQNMMLFHSRPFKDKHFEYANRFSQQRCGGSNAVIIIANMYLQRFMMMINHHWYYTGCCCCYISVCILLCM